MQVSQFILLTFVFVGLQFAVAAQQLSSTPKAQNVMLVSGVVYDPAGAVIQSAKVVAYNAKGGEYEAFTDENGVYKLMLPYSKYEFASGESGAYKSTPPAMKYKVIFEAAGFQPLLLRNYVVVDSTYGKMNLDVSLDIGDKTICELDVFETPERAAKKLELKKRN